MKRAWPWFGAVTGRSLRRVWHDRKVPVIDRDPQRLGRRRHGQSTGGHPRGYGAFPRVLGRYVREQKVLTLEGAVRKMTSLAAANVGLKDRGAIRAGAAADLVVLDPATIIDRSTTAEPKAMSEGVRSVWVNGQLVFDAGKTTTARPGHVLRRQ